MSQPTSPFSQETKRTDSIWSGGEAVTVGLTTVGVGCLALPHTEAAFALRAILVAIGALTCAVGAFASVKGQKAADQLG